jgi:hypothetical protein
VENVASLDHGRDIGIDISQEAIKTKAYVQSYDGK